MDRDGGMEGPAGAAGGLEASSSVRLKESELWDGCTFFVCLFFVLIFISYQILIQNQSTTKTEKSDAKLN